MKASRPCLGARHWSSGRTADRTWCRCDYTHVNYQCRHVRYVVKAWCTRYQARRVDPMPCSYWSSADVPGSSHVRCPPNIVAMYTSTLLLSCLAGRLICHRRATKPENCGPLPVTTSLLSEPLFARISFIVHSFGPQTLTLVHLLDGRSHIVSGLFVRPLVLGFLGGVVLLKIPRLKSCVLGDCKAAAASASCK